MKSYKKWSEAEIQFIHDNLGLFSDQDLAAKLSSMTGENISCGMVRRQRRKLGIQKQRGRPRKIKQTESIDS